MQNKFKALFQSRKFYAALIGLAVVALFEVLPNFPFSPEQVTNFVYILCAYILGVALDKPYAEKP